MSFYYWAAGLLLVCLPQLVNCTGTSNSARQTQKKQVVASKNQQVAPSQASALTDETALATWRKLDPRGDNYDAVLEAVRVSPLYEVQDRRALARTLIRGGNFKCKAYETSWGCTTESYTWLPLEPQADFNDPCLRRLLIQKVLGWLAAEDLVALQKEKRFAPIVRLAGPESDLPYVVLNRLEEFQPNQRLQLMTIAVKAQLPGLDRYVKWLNSAQCATLVDKLDFEPAVPCLDTAKHTNLLLRVALSEMDLDARKTAVLALTKVTSAKTTDALLKVAQADHCELAMIAASTLAERGQAAYLPQVPMQPSAENYLRALCLLAHDPNAARRLATFKEFLPSGEAVKASLHATDADGDETDDSETLMRATVQAKDLDTAFGLSDATSCKRLASQNIIECTLSGDYQLHYSFEMIVRFRQDPQTARLSIIELHNTTVSESNCEC